MVKIDIGRYIDELKGFANEGGDIDLYSLKKELISLNESSTIFDNFEKESMSIDKNVMQQIEDLSLLIRIRNLASKIKDKRNINDKLHSIHFNLNLLKNSSLSNTSSIKNILDVLLYNNDSKLDNVINELNDFKAKLDEVKKHYKNLLPKSLDNKLEIENKYNKHIEKLHSIHKKQKQALISAIKLFLRFSKKHINNLKKFKNDRQKHQ